MGLFHGFVSWVCSLDEKGRSLDEKGCSLDEKGCSVDEKIPLAFFFIHKTSTILAMTLARV